MADLGPPEGRGRLLIADKVVQKIASAAAREVDGITGTRSSWTHKLGRSLPRATATVAGGHARIAVHIAASWPLSLAPIAAAVHDHVTEQVTTLTGTTVAAVDVTIDDVVIHHAGNDSRLT